MGWFRLHRFTVSVFLLWGVAAAVLSPAVAQRRYTLTYHFTPQPPQGIKPRSSFATKQQAAQYVEQLPALLVGAGYWAAAVDSLALDSLQGHATLYTGNQYRWQQLTTDSASRWWLSHLPLASQKASKPLPLAPAALAAQLLDDLENHGYPFGQISWDSLRLTPPDGLSGRLVLQTGPLYKMDSVVQLGTARLNARFLHRYLQIPRGSPFAAQKLAQINRRLEELPFVTQQQPWQLQMLATGAQVQVHLEPQRSNIIQVLLGAMPASTQTPNNQLQLTADVNLLLRNAFGQGESLALTWQQIQYKSPRVHLGYQQPYVWSGRAGLDAQFDLLRKDTQFLNVQLMLGVPYEWSGQQRARLFYHWQQTFVSTIDTLAVLATRQLPDLADISLNTLGLEWQANTTNARFNPRQGYEWRLQGNVGLKRLARSTAVENLKDPADPQFNFARLYDTVPLRTYQLRAQLWAAHYWPLGRISAFKAGLQAGYLQSGNYFRNELFQIGGIRGLRGFDEESIFARGYAITTAEYRLLAGQNSYFFAFTDVAWSQYTTQALNQHYAYLGTGLGLALQTPNSQVNLSLAVGKRNDLPLSLRQAKIHVGFVNYF